MRQDELVVYAVSALERMGLTYMLVGSIASGMYGEPRQTFDIDIVIDGSLGQIEALCREFPEAEFYVSLAAARDAVSRGGQFNVIHPTSGNKIDFMMARADAWGREQLRRRQREQVYPGVPAYMASPEDVVLAKLWYYQIGESEKHLRDIAAIVQNADAEIELDVAYVERWVAALGLTSEWQAILARVAERRREAPGD